MAKKITKSAREIKEEKIKSLTEKLTRAKTITFADYRGLTANQLAELRAKVKAGGGEFIVEKNNLIKLSLKATKRTLPEEDLLTGPTATVVAYEDEVAPIKEIAESNKNFGLPAFKFGYFEQDFLSSESVEKLSKIPGKDVLRAKVVGSLNSPLYGIVSVLSGNLRNLVYALNQIKEKKGVS